MRQRHAAIKTTVPTHTVLHTQNTTKIWRFDWNLMKVKVVSSRLCCTALVQFLREPIYTNVFYFILIWRILETSYGQMFWMFAMTYGCISRKVSLFPMPAYLLHPSNRKVKWACSSCRLTLDYFNEKSFAKLHICSCFPLSHYPDLFTSSKAIVSVVDKELAL